MNGKKLVLALILSNTMSLLFLILWRVFNSTNLLFDQIIFLSIITFILASIMLSSSFSDTRILKWEKICVSLLAACLFYIFGTAVLLNVDRSRSLYIFAWVNECNKSMDCIEKYVTDNYGKRGWQEVFARLQEQDSRGLMNISNGHVELSKIGSIVLYTASLSANLFHLEGFKIEKNIQN
jgi:hypothetical protein